jgi:hypothetical protein
MSDNKEIIALWVRRYCSSPKSFIRTLVEPHSKLLSNCTNRRSNLSRSYYDYYDKYNNET